MKLAIIGLGNMGQTILEGILNNNILAAEDIAAADKKFAAADFALKNKYPEIHFTSDNKEAVFEADYVILAVKPQIFSQVLEEIKALSADKLIISIAAGIKREFIEAKLSQNSRVVRVMPNTPALVGEGMSALSFADDLAEKERLFVKKVFKAFGRIIEVKEEQMDAVTALSGSGPAFVYLFIEALSDAGVLKGLDRQTALKLAAQTLKGGAEMVLESQKHPAELKDMVTSPGGTTIAGVASLEESGFRSAVIKAVSAAAERSEELGK
ncbi:pyrroline-5-carboxylate reductase [Halanaerobium sp. Z-7514]|uniref:Pyrroline-5-carboxylate reductase n=1 Tax=Halanaerobium polyolivorans TaxID=2886943 RepID=A0AAW4WZ12_9FIRM|nr:pyrroline-5-carboxylate reductase [Halanaerobium polyolivorans]MCC3145019.1 pyrroline-5-carboxylate reductase [Halanaerobium polyolivorans]RQD72821.1 MAG: pyrroline-5-carboxylate reductase [Halanaerobium sp. MSAO_Bac5]